MTEAAIEAKLVRGVKALGGRAYKFVSPGNNGVPDRLIVLPGGKIIFAELKTERGRLSKVQVFQIEILTRLGCRTEVLHGVEDVTKFLDLLQKEGGHHGG